MEITSTNNDKVKYWEKLKTKKYRDQEKLFLVEDEHLVNIAINKGLAKEIITTNYEMTYDIKTFYVSDKVMRVLSEQVTSAKVIAVCHELKSEEVNGNILILDNLQDPGNLGTILRSAVAFDFKTIILGNTCVDVYNSKVVRASEGMLFYLNIIRCNLEEFLKDLDNSYTLVTTDVSSGLSIKDISYDKIAIVIGSEGSGVSKNIANMCDKAVKIPMTKECESLNAGVSASILMYEVYHG